MSEVITYIKESFEELKNNISWTPRSELQRLTMVVLIFSLIFSLAIWGADTVLSRLITIYFKLINGWSW
jgi:preprotein translocase subunit SecE